MTKPLRVVVVNDSATVRASLRHALAAAPDVTVVGEAADGEAAVEVAAALRPSLVLMDVVMPRVDGYAATRAIMARCPVPIVLLSSVVNPRDVAVAMESLRSGALAIAEALPPPHDPDYARRRDALLHLVRSMARVPVGESRDVTAASRLAPARAVRASKPVPATALGLVASTGGPGALVTIFRGLEGRSIAPVLLVQHLAQGFAEGFARWLGATIGRTTRIPAHLEALARDCVYVAPDDRHLGVDALGRAVLSDAAPVGLFRPSGTWLLQSMATSLGPRARAAVLTGMGADGADGAVALRGAGGRVAAQSEASCVVYGMPGQTVARGGADIVLPPEHIAAWLIEGEPT